MPSLGIWASFLPILIGCVGGFYFLGRWLRSGVRINSFAYWGLGLILWWWSKLPAVLSHLGWQYTQQDLHVVLFVGFVLHFIGYLLLLVGIARITLSPYPPRFGYYCFLWFVSALIYFSLTFFVNGFDVTYAPAWAGNLLFFIPAQFMIIYVVMLGVQQGQDISLRTTRCIISGMTILTCASLWYIFIQVSLLERSQWYTVASSSLGAPFLQFIGTALSICGLYYLSSHLEASRVTS